MALDQVPNHFQTMRIRIMANIGACFIKLNQFEDAVTSYEVISSRIMQHIIYKILYIKLY